MSLEEQHTATDANLPQVFVDDLDLSPAKISRVAGTDSATVKEYAAIYEKDGPRALPPIVVFRDDNIIDGPKKYLGDGLHRVASIRQSFKAAGKDPAKAKLPHILKLGTKRDAMLYAAGANAQHGKPRSPEDKRHIVECLLADEELATKSDRQIAAAAHVSPDLVAKVRKLTGKETKVRTGKDGKTFNVTNTRKAAKDRKTKAAEQTNKTAQTTDLIEVRENIAALAEALRGAAFPHNKLHQVKRLILAAMYVELADTKDLSRDRIAELTGVASLDTHPGQLRRAGLIHEGDAANTYRLTSDGTGLVAAAATRLREAIDASAGTTEPSVVADSVNAETIAYALYVHGHKTRWIKRELTKIEAGILAALRDTTAPRQMPYNELCERVPGLDKVNIEHPNTDDIVGGLIKAKLITQRTVSNDWSQYCITAGGHALINESLVAHRDYRAAHDDRIAAATKPTPPEHQTPVPEPAPTPAPLNLESRRHRHILAALAARANQIQHAYQTAAGTMPLASVLRLELLIGLDSGPVDPRIEVEALRDLWATRLCRNLATRLTRGQTDDLHLPTVSEFLKHDHATLTADAALSIPE